MKKLFSSLGLACCLLALFACVVTGHADTNTVADAASVGVSDGAEISGAMVAPFIQTLAATHPWILTLLAVMATARSVAKPLFSIVESSLGPDNAFAQKLKVAESGPIYRGVAWLLDFLFSIKVHLVTSKK